MQKLFRRTAELLSEHPILWLPYIAAELLASCLWRLRGLAEKGIFHWFATGHSVLGGDVALPLHDTAALTRASIAYLPVAIAAIVSVVCLFVTALMATAAMVNLIERSQRPNGRDILADLAAYWRRILLFALWFLIAFGALAAMTGGLFFYILFLAHRQDLRTSWWFEAGGTLVLVGCGAWLTIPATIRLLKKERAGLVSVQSRNQGTVLAIFAAEAGFALGFFVQKLEASMLFNSRWEVVALSVFNSLVANAPDAMLFVALGLLATKVSRESDPNKSPMIPELLSHLMPLHFGKTEGLSHEED